jgi:hypothetical protein
MTLHSPTVPVGYGYPSWAIGLKPQAIRIAGSSVTPHSALRTPHFRANRLTFQPIRGAIEVSTLARADRA